jgi:hypothetical protein
LAGNILEELNDTGATVFTDYLAKAGLSDLLASDNQGSILQNLFLAEDV